MKNPNTFREFFKPAFFVVALAVSSLISYGALTLLFLRQNSATFTITIAMWSLFFFLSGSMVGWQSLVAQGGALAFNQKFDFIKVAVKAPLILFFLAVSFVLIDLFLFNSLINAIAVMILGLIGSFIFSTFNGFQFRLGNPHLVAVNTFFEATLRLVLIFFFAFPESVNSLTAFLIVSPPIIMSIIQAHKNLQQQLSPHSKVPSLFWTSLTFAVANLLLTGFPFLVVSLMGQRADDLGAALLILAIIRAPAVLLGYSGQPALVKHLSNSELGKPVMRLTALLFAVYLTFIVVASTGAAVWIPGTNYWLLLVTFGVSGLLFSFLLWETARIQISAKSLFSAATWILVGVTTCFTLLFSPYAPTTTIQVAAILPAALGALIMLLFRHYRRNP